MWPWVNRHDRQKNCVFLDPQIPDIPNTVAKAGEEPKLNVSMFNLHAGGL
jgi:orotidine-5'-phosphate decarboxylase